MKCHVAWLVPALLCLAACDYGEMRLATLPSDALGGATWVHRPVYAPARAATADPVASVTRTPTRVVPPRSAYVAPAANTTPLVWPAQSEPGHDVALLASRAPRTHAVALLTVRARADDGSSALAELRVRGEEAGADAVTGITLHADADDDRIAISGIGVRAEDATEARPFDVVGTIDVDAAAGHEADACVELRRRTRDLDADMVIDLSYEAGDSLTPLHLRATAIRFRI